MPADVPFLLCLQDLDRLRAKYDNLKDVLVQGARRILVIRAFGHPWILLNKLEALVYASQAETPQCHLTESELRQLYRRFGHSSAKRLQRVLERAGRDFDASEIAKLTKYYEQYQKYGRSPGRFKFTLKDDREFNYFIFVDIVYLNGEAVLYVVDETIAFQAARFVRSMSAKDAWEVLRACWM